MAIKSTCCSLYVKYTRVFREMGWDATRLVFSPEFFCESMALNDNLYPSRIILRYLKMIQEYGEENDVIRAVASNYLEETAHTFSGLLKEGVVKEAEAVKLLVNTYLSLRV